MAGGEWRWSRASFSPDPADEFFPVDWDLGYHRAVSCRFITGGFNQPGPAAVWMRALVELVKGEALSPLQRVMIVADSGNGISSAIDYRSHLFINVDLSVHLHRLPEGEWVGLDAITVPEPTGIGLADTALFDQSGPLGRSCQTLLLDRR